RSLDRLLDRLRRNVFAARSLEQLFLPVRYTQETIFVERADVAGLEPSITREHRLRRFRLVVIPAHHVWTTNLDLAVFRNANVDIRNRRADRSHTVVFNSTGSNHRRRLCQTVTL